jgi:hypothetical protein
VKLPGPPSWFSEVQRFSGRPRQLGLIVRQQNMDEWISCGVVIEGDPIDLGGINPWGCRWESLKQPPVELPHPRYTHQRHEMWIYEIEDAGRKVIFAAGELSANVWGFYIPRRTRA